MRRFYALVIVLAICVVGFGFYRGWFVLSSPNATEGSNQVNINLAADQDKMKDDVEIVKDKAAELTGTVTPVAEEPSDQLIEEEVPPPDTSRKDRESTDATPEG
jgi:hypothetical protein